MYSIAVKEDSISIQEPTPSAPLFGLMEIKEILIQRKANRVKAKAVASQARRND